jgi:glycosyltransferase involved in cell wall biosynthesis
MRLLFASEFYFPSIGGVQEVMRQIGERFAREGHEVTIATTHLPERTSRKADGVAIEEFRISGNLVNGMTGEVERYREFVLRQEYDLLMVKAAQQWTFDALLPVLDRIAKPKIFIPCGFSGMHDPRYRQYFEDMPAWLRKFDRLIFYATDYRDINFARSHGSQNVVLSSNGADEREFNVRRDDSFRARHAIAEDAFLVMTVGSLTGIKGHHEVTKAFERCTFGGRPACLLLIGNQPRRPRDEGSLYAYAQGWIARAKAMYQIGGAVRLGKWVFRPMLLAMGLRWLLDLLGYVPLETFNEAVRRANAVAGRQARVVDLPRAEVVQAYLNSDLFVFASKIEYSPLVLFEAAAAGLPFLSVPVGNAAEIAEWTGGGIICNATVDAAGYTQVDPVQFAKEIDALAGDRATLERLGANGRRAWQERFTWTRIFRHYQKIFEECVHSRQDENVR